MSKENKATIYYYDIGDYLNREDKLKIISSFKSFANPDLPLKVLEPNEHGDWINERNDVFSTFFGLAPEKRLDVKSQSFFLINSLGLTTGRDVWAINFSKEELIKNLGSMVSFYNEQLFLFKTLKSKSKGEVINLDNILDTDTKKISWSRGLKRSLENAISITIDKSKSEFFSYRPFTKLNVYHCKSLNEYVYQWSKFLPSKVQNNIFICISSSGTTNSLSLLISNSIVDAHFNGDTQAFPLYYYEENNTKQEKLNFFDTADNNKYIRRDAISDFILERAKKQYGKNVSKEDIFYFVYGFLHSKEYRETFANDLKKMLPRLPLLEDVKDFWAFSKAGRQLAELHLNYETVPPSPDVITLLSPLSMKDTLEQVNKDELEYLNYRVEKMRFPAKGQKDKIIYNSQITIEHIPEKAYQYVVNGKSAIEWIMERYQVTVHKESGIKNDPNDWAAETGKPRYILDLLLSIINVSVQTVDIVNNLPKISFDE